MTTVRESHLPLAASSNYSLPRSQPLTFYLHPVYPSAISATARQEEDGASVVKLPQSEPTTLSMRASCRLHAQHPERES